MDSTQFFTTTTATLRNNVEHNECWDEVPLFLKQLQKQVLNIVKSWNGKKDLLLKVNYMDYVTKWNKVKMLIK